MPQGLTKSAVAPIYAMCSPRFSQLVPRLADVCKGFQVGVPLGPETLRP